MYYGLLGKHVLSRFAHGRYARSCRFPVRTSEASVAVRKQRAEQRETLEQSERSQAHRVGDISDQAYKMDPALTHPACTRN